MSLINDALKRASQSDKNRPRDTGSPAPMLPTAPERRRSIVPILIGVWIFLALAAFGWSLCSALFHRDISGEVEAPIVPVIETPPPVVFEPEPAPAPLPAAASEQGPGSAGASPYRPEPTLSAASTNNSGGAAATPHPSAPLPAAASTNDAARVAFGVADIDPEIAELFQSTNPAASPAGSLSAGMGTMVAPPRPAGAAPPVFPELKLQGILYSRNNPRAVINGQTVGEKELVGGVRVLTIAPNKVTVEWNGQTRDLKLEGP